MNKGSLSVTRISVSVVASLLSSYAFAIGENINVSGFLTTAATYTDNDESSTYSNGVATDETTFSSPDNRFGIQIGASLTEQASITAQFIAKADDHYDLSSDWAFLKYKPSQSFHIHAGKFKIPQYLVSDYEQVGYAYPWVRPPQDVYITNPLTSLSGLDFLYTVDIGVSQLVFQFYWGTDNHLVTLPARSIDLNPVLKANFPKGSQIDFETYDTAGISLETRSNVFTFRLSHMQTTVDISTQGSGITLVEGVEGEFNSAGMIVDWKNFLLYSEYIERDVKAEVITAFPDQTAWYITIGYRVATFLPYLTYSEITDGPDSHVLALQQESTALGLRYDINNNTALKFEALYAEPDEDNHGLFDTPVKDGRVYTLAMDVIF